ncbi:MAG: Endoglucanase-like protein [Gemmatimonadetes bacterium]|nr:Endoglucanase-like protein [Gemmatimonadota bacterium]
MRLQIAGTIAAAALLLTSCGDGRIASPSAGVHPLAPGATASSLTSIQRIACIGRRGTPVITCGAPSSNSARDLIVGGQNQYVTLTSSNVTYDGGTHILSSDVSVTNLIPQALGTNDGATGDGTGLKVFFDVTPTVTDGTGAVTIVNPTGTGTFTSTNQPYYQYPGDHLGGDNILSTNEVSSTVNWQFNIDPTVNTFEFYVYVSANVHYPNGYVVVDSTSAFINQTATTTITATSRSAVGNAIGSSTLTYSSTAPAVATVNASTGQLTAVGPGFATINVTSSESTTGSVTVQVCPNLAVGEVYTTSGPGAGNVCVGGTASDAEYTYMPLNTSTSGASLRTIGTGIQAVTGPPTPDRIPTSVASNLGPLPASSVVNDFSIGTFAGADAKLAAFQARRAFRQSIPRATAPESSNEDVHGPSALNEVSPTASGVAPAEGADERLTWYPTETSAGHVNVSADAMVSGSLALRMMSVPSVGDAVSYNTNSACSGSPSVRTGLVRSVSQHAIIVSDTMNPTGGFTTAQYDSMALEFDTIAWPVDSANFTDPTDIDVNGHVIIFFTRALNELSPPASSSVIPGFFASKDVFGSDDCSNSNGAPTMGTEILYMAVPDPTGSINSNVRTVSFVRGSAIVTAVHEFQHLINGFARAYVTGASFFETAWTNEALSSVAEELAFYRTSVGLAPKQNIVVGNINTGPDASRRVTAFNAFANPNFGRLRPWLQRPDTTGITSGTSANTLAPRGISWAFLRYASDRANVGDPTFFRNMVNSNLEGIPNIQHAIGGMDPWQWLRDCIIALYADDAISVATQYKTQSWDYRSMYGALSSGGYVNVLVPRALTNNVALTLLYKGGGASSFDRFGVPATKFANINLTQSSAAPLPTVLLAIIRTK